MNPAMRLNSERAAANIDVILASLAVCPKSARELCEELGLQRYTMSMYLAHLRGQRGEGIPRRIRVCEFMDGPRGARIPLYGLGTAPDARPGRTKVEERSIAVDSEAFFIARKEAVGKRIRPPSRMDDPLLAWIPQRDTYREAA